jgi:hypothetical protein
LAFD